MRVRATEQEPGHLTTLPSRQQPQRSPLTLQPSTHLPSLLTLMRGKCCLLDALLLFDSYNAVFLSSSKLALPMPGYSPTAGETERELVCTEHRGEDGHQAELQCRVARAMLGTSSPAMTQRRTKKSERAFRVQSQVDVDGWVEYSNPGRENPAETCLSSIAHGNCLWPCSRFGGALSPLGLGWSQTPACPPLAEPHMEFAQGSFPISCLSHPAEQPTSLQKKSIPAPLGCPESPAKVKLPQNEWSTSLPLPS